MSISVKEIVTSYLVFNGYHGLFNENGECGCQLSDLGPCCEGIQQECIPGYKVNCTLDCEHDCGSFLDDSWHIQKGKP